MEDQLLAMLDATQAEVADLGAVFQAMREDGRHDNAVASYLEDLFMFALFAAGPQADDYPPDYLGLLSALLSYQFTQEHARVAVKASDNWKDFEQTVPFSLTLLVQDANVGRASLFCDAYIGVFAKFSYLFCVVMTGDNPASCFQKIATMQDYCEFTLNQRGMPVEDMPWRQRMHEDHDCCCGHDHGHHHADDCCCGHDHHHGEDCSCGHDHGEDCSCGHHHADDDCCCGDHGHDHVGDCCCGNHA